MAISALIVSILALILSGISVWYKTISPGKIVGVLSGLEFKLYVNEYGTVFNRKVLPFLFIKNVGARAAIMENIRLKICFDDNNVFYAYPRSSVSGIEDVRHFKGAILSAHEPWENNLPFIICRPNEYGNYAHQKANVAVEIKLTGKDKWKTIKTIKEFSFHSKCNYWPKTGDKAPQGSHFVWLDTKEDY